MEYVILEEFPLYEIYSSGKVIRIQKSSMNGKILKRRELYPTKAKNGYMTVRLSRPNGTFKQFYLHRLIYMAFHSGDDITGLEIDHVNGLRSGKDENGVDANALSNLRAVSHKDNCRNEVSRERYRKANSLDKGKFNRDKMMAAQGEENHKRLIRVYKSLKKKHGHCGIFLLMKKGHCGYPRARKIVKEMEQQGL